MDENGGSGYLLIWITLVPCRLHAALDVMVEIRRFQRIILARTRRLSLIFFSFHTVLIFIFSSHCLDEESLLEEDWADCREWLFDVC
jgi:hypothetical protein